MTSNPVIVPTPDGVWTFVAHNISGGTIRKLGKSPRSYKWTYRVIGDAPPETDQEGVVLFGKEEFEAIPNSNGIDLYVYCYGDNGSVRIDEIPQTIGLDPGSVKRGAFGEIITAQKELLAGWTFPVSVNPGIIDAVTGTINGGTVSHSQSFAVLNTGADPAGQAQIQTRKTSRYVPGYSGEVTFTAVYGAAQPDSEQGVGLINDLNGWAFGYDGEQFGFLRRNNGVDNWIYKDAWNRDIREVLNPQLGNVYEIKYQWLGFGAQYASIENQYGDIALVHIIPYSNQFTDTSTESPNLPLRAWVKNIGNTTPIELRTPSASAGLDGDAYNDALSVALSDGVKKTLAVAGTGQPVISFYNSETWLGKINTLSVQALRITFSSEGTKPMVYRVLANAVPNDGTFAFVNEQISAVQTNKTFTSFTGGYQIGYYPVGKTGTLPIDLVAAGFRGFPGQYITIVADTVANNQEVSAGVSFRQFL